MNETTMLNNNFFFQNEHYFYLDSDCVGLMQEMFNEPPCILWRIAEYETSSIYSIGIAFICFVPF